MKELRTIDMRPHEFEHNMMQHIDILRTTTDSEGLVTLLEVYVYDFIAMSNNMSHTHLLQISCAILHGIHAISPPPSVTGHNGFEPVVLSKLEKGEVKWEHIKETLVCIMNGLNETIQLPLKKCKDICVLMRKLLKKRCVKLNEFKKLAGKLQHASMGIPRGRSLSIPINMDIPGNP